MNKKEWAMVIIWICVVAIIIACGIRRIERISNGEMIHVSETYMD